MADAHNTVVVVSNLPDQAAARQLAGTLVEERLAACVNIMAPCGSVYRWQGEVVQESEVPVWIKTSTSRLDQLTQRLAQLHPYDVPEILALRPSEVLPAYADWVDEQTSVR